ncbi:MAG: hypothetical protein ACFFDC_13370 [Promethearchaeota archaeon]
MTSVEHKSLDKHTCLVCTWDEEEKCLDCELQERLDCRWKQSLLIRFYKAVGFAMVSAILAFILIGLFISWIPLIIYVIFWIFFFGFFEIRVLCSHCPYYAEEGRILHCLANHGTIKVWRYHPEPLNSFEKFGFLAGAVFFVLFPLITELFGILTFWNQEDKLILILMLVVLAAISLLGGIYFFYFLRSRICPKCINFSCPLNKVPKELVDAYLKKNPIMKAAWEDAGYQLD